MLRSSFSVVVFFLTGVLALSGCDSSPGVEPIDVDGQYSVERYEFIAQDLDVVVNVRDSLSLLNMELFAQDREFLLRYRFPEQTALSRIRGTFTLRGTTLQLNVEEGDPNQLLLPAGASIPMQVRDDGDRLTSDLQRQQANLNPYGINQQLNGHLHIRLNRD